MRFRLLAFLAMVAGPSVIVAGLFVIVAGFSVRGSAQRPSLTAALWDGYSQGPEHATPRQPSSRRVHRKLSPTPLAALLAQALASNLEIRAAEHAFLAAQQLKPQVSTMPQPRLMLREQSVGNPLPLGGYNDSMFAYVGVGVAQEFPFPGKLRVRGEIAQAQAAVTRQQIRSIRRSVLRRVAFAYFQLAYAKGILALLQQQQSLLQQAHSDALLRYRNGAGSQPDVLAAQLRQTALLQQMERQREQAQLQQIQLRLLLNRQPHSAPVVPEPLRLVRDALPPAADSPLLAQQRQLLQKRKLQLRLAHKSYDPDFSAQYMYMRSANPFPDMYQLSVSVRIPFFWRRKQDAEVAQAVERAAEQQTNLDEMRIELRAAIASQAAAMRTARSNAAIACNALLPQAQASLRSALLAYGNGQGVYGDVVRASDDLLRVQSGLLKEELNARLAQARLHELIGGFSGGKHRHRHGDQQ